MAHAGVFMRQGRQRRVLQVTGEQGWAGNGVDEFLRDGIPAPLSQSVREAGIGIRCNAPIGTMPGLHAMGIADVEMLAHVQPAVQGAGVEIRQETIGNQAERLDVVQGSLPPGKVERSQASS